ncbi:MAG TPA: hypothetical protein VE998_05155, partial [Terriglobales bacterium]|nr:hypothetical protein [Terriglobales bacterium]
MADEIKSDQKTSAASGNGASGNGANGSKIKTAITALREDAKTLPDEMKVKVKEQVKDLEDPTKTQLYTSVFRHKHDDTPRNRALGVLSNVFLHLHPAKI